MTQFVSAEPKGYGEPVAVGLRTLLYRHCRTAFHRLYGKVRLYSQQQPLLRLLNNCMDETTVMDFIKYAIRHFITTQQYYEWSTIIRKQTAEKKKDARGSMGIKTHQIRSGNE